MPTIPSRLASLAGLAFIASCAVGTLFDAPPPRVITVTPSRVVVSAARDEPKRDSSLVISTASQNATPQWTAHRAAAAEWLALGDSSGTAPATLGLTLNPADLAPGTYRDTVIIVPSDAAFASVRVPVEFQIVASAPPPPPPPATSLAFTMNPPAVLLLNGSFSVEVTARDGQGQTATGFSEQVTVTLQGPIVTGELSGQTSVTAANGIATFSNLRVTGACTGCRLVASASGLTSATSSSFNVVP